MICPAQNEMLSKFARMRWRKFRALPLNQVQDQDSAGGLNAVLFTLGVILRQFQELKNTVDTGLKQDIPDYKANMDEAKTVYTNVSSLLEAFGKACDALKEETEMPQAIRDYATGGGQAERGAAEDGAGGAGADVEAGRDEAVGRIPGPAQETSRSSWRRPADTRLSHSTGCGSRRRRVSIRICRRESQYNFSGEQLVSMAIASLKTPSKTDGGVCASGRPAD